MTAAVPKGAYESKTGSGQFRVTKYKGQVIGVEIWPEGSRSHWQYQIPYRRPRGFWPALWHALAGNPR